MIQRADPVAAAYAAFAEVVRDHPKDAQTTGNVPVGGPHPIIAARLSYLRKVQSSLDHLLSFAVCTDLARNWLRRTIYAAVFFQYAPKSILDMVPYAPEEPPDLFRSEGVHEAERRFFIGIQSSSYGRKPEEQATLQAWRRAYQEKYGEPLEA